MACWEPCLEESHEVWSGRGEGCRELFDGQGSPLQAPEWSTPTCRESSKVGRRLAWIRKELLTKTKHEEEAQRRWKVAAFQPQWFCDSVLERAICLCVCLCGGDEGIPGTASG